MATRAEIQFLRYHATRGQVKPTVRIPEDTKSKVVRQGWARSARGAWMTVKPEGRKVAGIQ